MATTTITLRQPTEVMVHGDVTHYMNGGRCLQCNETEVYVSENGGTHLGTIDASGRPYFLTVEVHSAPVPVKVATKRPCYCDTAYHPQGC